MPDIIDLWNKAKNLGTIEGVCCFCNGAIDRGGFDPCTLSFSTSGDEWQSWPCHAACYRERLGDLPYARDLFEDTDN